MIQLKNSLDAVVPIKMLAQESEIESLKSLGEKLHNLDLLRQKIKETLNEDAPVQIAKGNTIAKGFSQDLDELRAISTGGKSFLDKIVQREIQRTGISSLKIASNNVFGYYI